MHAHVLLSLRRPVTAPASFVSLEMQMQSSTAAQQIALGGNSNNSLGRSSVHVWPITVPSPSTSSTSDRNPHAGVPASSDSSGVPSGLQGKAMQQQLPPAIASLLFGFKKQQQHQQQQPYEQPRPEPELPHQQQGPLQLLQQMAEQHLWGWWKQHAEVAEPLLKGVLSAPLIAGIVAIMIGSCPPLQVRPLTNSSSHLGPQQSDVAC